MSALASDSDSPRGAGVIGKPLLLAGLGAATISTSPILVALAGASGTATAFFRSVLALPLLAVLALLEGRRLGGRSRSERARAGLAGVFLGIDLILWTHAIADVGAGIATVLGNLQVLFVAGIAWLVFRERPNRAVLAALPVVLAGVVLVSGLVGHPAAGQHPHPLAGIWYGIGTAVSYAAFLLVLRRSSASSGHIAGPVLDVSVGSALTALLASLVLGGLVPHPLWPALGWLALLAVLSQTIGWMLITSSLPRLPAAVSSLMLLLQPAAALVLAAVILAQEPSLPQVIGAVLTCGGALVASLAATRAPAPRPAMATAAVTSPLPTDVTRT